MFSVKHNIPEIKDKLKRLKKLATGNRGYQFGLVKHLEKTTKDLRRTTPRSSGTGSQNGKHLAEGWTLHTIGGGGKDRVPLLSVIYNRFTHRPTGQINAGAELQDAGGAGRGYTLLEIVEYGSPPHEITPVNKPTLKFQLKNGEWRSPKHVDHPGTRPHGMVRVARAKLKYALSQYKKRFEQRLIKEWTS